MEIFSLIKREVKQPIRPLLIFVAISGFANAILIGIINTAAEYTSNSEVNNKFFVMFALGVAIFLFAKKFVLDKSSIIVESVMHRIRHRIVDKIRHTELANLEARGTSPLYARLTQDTNVITNSATVMISSTQSAIMIAFTILYIGTISLWSFFLIVGSLSIGTAYYFQYSKGFETGWKNLSIKETDFFEKLNHILRGFKEIKINRSKNEGVFDSYKGVNSSLKNYRINLSTSYNVLMIFSQTFFYLLMGVLLFILPRFHAEYSSDVIKVTAAVLFIMGPFDGLVSSLHMFDNANNATRNIVALEDELEAELKKNELSTTSQNQKEVYQSLPYFDNIQFQNLSYSYPKTKEHEHIFTVGPVNLTFRKGELIFITGGNGSGKSTFLKLLTGLYPPQTGQIVVDVDIDDQAPIPVSPKNYQQYRNLFSTIFSDFHLFDKLYGVEGVSERIVNRVLENMELPKEKTRFENGKFTNLHLSSGQKKRLALTTCIIEDKPIYIFDEVAADLDPEFRDKYYYELIMELKDRNKTVIVVSHDRHYWTVPDRLLEMREGAIRELSREEIDSLLSLNKD